MQPLSLCALEAADRPALLRMLGGTLIAANDAVASDVVTRCVHPSNP